MKIEAYKCDNCEEIKETKYIVCIMPQEDLFNPLMSFPIEYNNLDKSNIHYCLGCYNKHVGLPLSSIDKGKDSTEWEQKRQELSYMLRKRCVMNAIKRGKK